jgi:hypothetical protein
MQPESLIELLEERPFVPLRLHLSDGRKHEIRHPEMAVVTDDVVAVGSPRSIDIPVSDVTYCAAGHIVEVEPMPDARSSRSASTSHDN